MKNYNIHEFEPKNLLKHFQNLANIPHISFHEKALSDYLYKFLKPYADSIKQDKLGDIVCYKKASKGCENWPVVTVQGHIDMVGVAKHGANIDLVKDHIKPYVDENGWLRAENTSLGADNGIAVVMIMELFANDQIKHGPIEAVLTVQEEVGCVGAKAIKKNSLKGKYLLNIDGECEDEVHIGCCGGAGKECHRQLKLQKADPKRINVEIKMYDFKGGHSGNDIHQPHVNVIKEAFLVIRRFLNANKPCNIVKCDFGNANNAIPTSGSIILAINASDYKTLENIIKERKQAIKTVFGHREKEFKYELKKLSSKASSYLVDKHNLELINCIVCFKNGIDTLHFAQNTMYSSTNLGKLVVDDKGKCYFAWLPRSFYPDEFKRINDEIITVCNIFGFKDFKPLNTFSPWVPMIEENKLIPIVKKIYQKNLGLEVKLTSVPGGLETADLIQSNKSFGNNVISFGPNIVNPHSISEAVEIKSISKIWKVFLDILASLDK